MKQILARGDSIVATCRNPAGADKLNAALASSAGSGLAIALPLDVADEASVAALPGLLASKGVSSIDVLGRSVLHVFSATPWLRMQLPSSLATLHRHDDNACQPP